MMTEPEFQELCTRFLAIHPDRDPDTYEHYVDFITKRDERCTPSEGSGTNSTTRNGPLRASCRGSPTPASTACSTASWRSSVPGELLTEHEVAAEYGLSVGTLRDWRYKKAVLPFVKLGSSVRYRRSAIEAYINEHTVATDARPASRSGR